MDKEKNENINQLADWSVVENYINEKYDLSAAQFDSILIAPSEVPLDIIYAGIKSKMKLGDTSSVIDYLNDQSPDFSAKVCESIEEYRLSYCIQFKAEALSHGNLKDAIIKMYFDDQKLRGNLMHDIAKKYEIDSLYEVGDCGNLSIDERNQCLLKKIISMHGFPNKSMIGKDALNGVFMIIQHADNDTSWQRKQLVDIKKLVDSGDFSPQKYAYLYDRIQLNAGLPQRYGTQFSGIKDGELVPYNIEDPENVNKRRSVIGLMPLEMYVRISTGYLNKSQELDTN